MATGFALVYPKMASKLPFPLFRTQVTCTPMGTSEVRSGGWGPVVGGTVVGVGGVVAQAGAPSGTVAPATRVAWARTVPGAIGATATIHEMVVPRGTPFTSNADGLRPGAKVVT